MSLVGTFIRHPRKLFLRRALFQVHLWGGVLLAMYLVVIALTGSLLVFRSELTRAQLPADLSPYDPAHVAQISAVLAKFKADYPDDRVTNLVMPSGASPAFLLRAMNSHKQPFVLVADPVTAALHLQRRTWVDWVYDLHVTLLLGNAHGMQVNGVGAAILLLLSGTGLVLWWPGIRIWTRGLRINFRSNWRRINFDLHNSIGIWTLLIVSWWAFSGIYFAWYRQVSAVVAFVSPLRGMVSPTSVTPAISETRVSLASILEAVHRASPAGHLFSLSDPALTGQVVYALVDLKAPGDFSHRDIITLSTTNAEVLTVWHYGSNHTVGDWILWAMHPLHFGTLWGLPGKILYALLGLSLAVLTLTGLVMYWNRYLRHRFL